MKIFIRSTGNISPQHTFGHPAFLETLEETIGNRLACIEPDYKSFIDGKLIRRMSRIIKMGVASASECLNEAGITSPDAIITGTAYGCLEDSVSFLSKMVEFREEMLTPTAFIQSTHNTVAAQIALMLHCHAYNNTFVHRGFSFESALTDALMLIKESDAKNVLVGGIDEITNVSHTILSRLGLYKKTPVSNKDLFLETSKGTIAGEGAAFFMISSEAGTDDYATLRGNATFYKPQSTDYIINKIQSFIESHNSGIDEIDLVIAGKNGDLHEDRVYNQLNDSIFKNHYQINYKDLCGEYPTAISFALWLASNILKTGKVPQSIKYHGRPTAKIRNILIYNHYQNIHHSLMLVSAPGGE